MLKDLLVEPKDYVFTVSSVTHDAEDLLRTLVSDLKVGTKFKTYDNRDFLKISHPEYNVLSLDTYEPAYLSGFAKEIVNEP